MKIINKILGAIVLFVLTIIAMLAACIGLMLRLPLMVIECLINFCYKIVDFSEEYRELYDKE